MIHWVNFILRIFLYFGVLFAHGKEVFMFFFVVLQNSVDLAERELAHLPLIFGQGRKYPEAWMGNWQKFATIAEKLPRCIMRNWPRKSGIVINHFLGKGLFLLWGIYWWDTETVGDFTKDSTWSHEIFLVHFPSMSFLLFHPNVTHLNNASNITTVTMNKFWNLVTLYPPQSIQSLFDWKISWRWEKFPGDEDTVPGREMGKQRYK